jgi:hypothetical protein
MDRTWPARVASRPSCTIPLRDTGRDELSPGPDTPRPAGRLVGLATELASAEPAASAVASVWSRDISALRQVSSRGAERAALDAHAGVPVARRVLRAAVPDGHRNHRSRRSSQSKRVRRWSDSCRLHPFADWRPSPFSSGGRPGVATVWQTDRRRHRRSTRSGSFCRTSTIRSRRRPFRAKPSQFSTGACRAGRTTSR